MKYPIPPELKELNHKHFMHKVKYIYFSGNSDSIL